MSRPKCIKLFLGHEYIVDAKNGYKKDGQKYALEDAYIDIHKKVDEYLYSESNETKASIEDHFPEKNSPELSAKRTGKLEECYFTFEQLRGVLYKYRTPGNMRIACVFFYFLKIDFEEWDSEYKAWKEWAGRQKEEKERFEKTTNNLEGQWVYYFKTVEGEYFRSIVRIYPKQKGNKENERKVEYESTRAKKIIGGKLKLDSDQRLFIRFVNLDGNVDINVNHFRAICDDKTVSRIQIDKGLIVGIRTVNYDKKFYANPAILYKPLKGSNISNFTRKIFKEEEDLDNIEQTFLKFLSLKGTIEIEPIRSFRDLNKTIRLYSCETAKKGFGKLKNDLAGREWVSISRPYSLRYLHITSWDFDFDKLTQKCLVTCRKRLPFYGEISKCGNGRIWVELLGPDNERKVLFGHSVGAGKNFRINFLRTAINEGVSNQYQHSVTREILIPKSLIPDEYIEIVKTEPAPVQAISYENFVQHVGLDPAVKLYFSSRRYSRLSFPSLDNWDTQYSQQLASLKYAGKYLIYGLNKYSSNPGDLFRFKMSIDQIGQVRLQKKYETSNGYHIEDQTLNYFGLSQFVNSTLVVSLQHIRNKYSDEEINVNKDQEFRQNAMLHLFVDDSKETQAPKIMIGQLADTDYGGYPDCSICFAVRRELFDDFYDSISQPGVIEKDCLEYEHVQTKLKPALASLSKNFGSIDGKEIATIDEAIELISGSGGIYFRQYRNKKK